MNPSGGLACFGEAILAQAIAQVCELTWQLKGQAVGRQVEGATVGVTANQGLFGRVVGNRCSLAAGLRPSHWAAIAVFVIGAVLLVRSAQDHRRGPAGRILGLLTAAIYAAILIYTLIPPSVDRSVPLRLTDLATVVVRALDATALGLCVHLLLGPGAIGRR